MARESERVRKRQRWKVCYDAGGLDTFHKFPHSSRLRENNIHADCRGQRLANRFALHRKQNDSDLFENGRSYRTCGFIIA
jgi:hypothetical protein